MDIDRQTVFALGIAFAMFVIIAVNPGGLLRKRTGPPLPPGPTPSFFYGNMKDIPRKRQYLKFASWKQEYGDVVRFRILHRPFVVLNSRKAVNALFVKKSTIYSDRPVLVLFEKWAGWTWSLPGLRYGDEMTLHRRLLSTGLSPTACREYYNSLQNTAIKLAEKVAKTPQDWSDGVHHMIGGNVLKMTYDYDVQESNDPWMARAEKILHVIQDLGPMGTHPADVIPPLANLPPRIFGSKLAENMGQLRKLLNAVYLDPYNEVKATLDSGKDRPCFTANMITANMQSDGSVEHEGAIRGTAATNYTVGVETVESSLNTFAIAMMMFPDVQERAQAELDEYFNGQRLPTLNDRGRLPYIDAVLMEVMRWQPATPMAVARKMAQSDVYNGMLIEKGTTVIANSWQCLHDPDDYPNPHRFLPDRYIPSSPFNPTPKVAPPDPRDFGFGYGRRACPGRPFAEAQLWITIATTLALFSFELPLDKKGKPIYPDLEYESGVAVQFPKPFKVNMKLRSKAAQEMLDVSLSNVKAAQA